MWYIPSAPPANNVLPSFSMVTLVSGEGEETSVTILHNGGEREGGKRERGREGGGSEREKKHPREGGEIS